MPDPILISNRAAGRKLPGAPPGTILVDPQAAAPRITVFGYGPDGHVERDIADPAEIPPLLKDWPVVWVNVDGVGHEPTLRRLAEDFQLHRLALEDVSNVVQRPKTEEYEGCLYVVTRMAHLDETLQTEQLSLFVSSNWVLTFQVRQGDCLEPVRDRIRRGAGRIRSAGADYLAYALLDTVVDHYFPILEELGERLEALEGEVLDRPEPKTVARIHQSKRELLTLRRAIWPQREMINALLRDQVAGVGRETRLYLRDCYDHVSQIIDILEIYRELGNGLLEVYLSSLSNRMNQVMKVLTMIATIFIPLSFVAGVYGMNFEFMPELSWTPAYFIVLGLMFSMGVGMLFAFWRKGWLTRDGR